MPTSWGHVTWVKVYWVYLRVEKIKEQGQNDDDEANGDMRLDLRRWDHPKHRERERKEREDKY